MTRSSQRGLYALWLAVIAGFALLHAAHLSADFPNHSPWMSDWAKYTDEGWYANAAMRAHLLGHWYLPGEFNPAVAVPVWPFLCWILFCFTGVSLEAARGLAVACFVANLALSYMLLRARGSRWMALLALTLIVTSPFLYCFSRLAILEPLLTALTLAALNLAIRLPRLRRPLAASVVIGLLFALMAMTKTTGLFLLPALGWALLVPLRPNWKLALRCATTAAATSALAVCAGLALIIHAGLLADFQNYFQVNAYIKPPQRTWPLVSLWWSFHGGLWIDRILVPLAGLIVLSAVLSALPEGRRAAGRRLLADPVFGASLWAVAGCIFFMTVQNHPQPRYFAVAAFFCFFVVAQGAEALLASTGPAFPFHLGNRAPLPAIASRLPGFALLAAAAVAACANAASTLNYAAHPEYTFVNAAKSLAQYIDAHPNGNRTLASVSGDELCLITRVPALGEDFGTQELDPQLAAYRPGWFATWNGFDPGTLEALHTYDSVEQVAAYRVFDHPDRNLLVLFKLHPLPNGQTRDPAEQNLQVPLPRDKIGIPVE